MTKNLIDAPTTTVMRRVEKMTSVQTAIAMMTMELLSNLTMAPMMAMILLTSVEEADVDVDVDKVLEGVVVTEHGVTGVADLGTNLKTCDLVVVSNKRS